MLKFWTAEVWTVKDTSSDVDAPNLDYKRTNNVDICITTMRMTVVGFDFHNICVLNSNTWEMLGACEGCLEKDLTDKVSCLSRMRCLGKCCGAACESIIVSSGFMSAGDGTFQLASL